MKTTHSPSEAQPETDIEPQKTETRSHSGTGFFNVIKSTFAAAIGIQSNTNRERDFTEGKASSFIIAGLVFVIIFILVMIGIVQLVLSLAQ